MDKIKEGSIVTIKIDENNEQTYIIVSDQTHQEIKNSDKLVPYNFVIKSSKIGKSLIGKSVGQFSNLELFGEIHKIEILSVTYSI